MEWFEARNIDVIDSPSLILYPDRIRHNIRACVQLVKDVSLLRPHVKTNKIGEVCQLMMDEGISRFKCATIAEAEMLGMIGAPDVLLAYPMVGPKINRYLDLIHQFPSTNFSCLVDNADAAMRLATASGKPINVFIDLDTGMNRTGIPPSKALDLAKALQNIPHVKLIGLHAYDGHLHHTDPAKNNTDAAQAFEPVSQLVADMITAGMPIPVVVAGGSFTFPFYRTLDVQCSPGTFVLWDWSYKHHLPDEPFQYAAVLLSRVISVTGKHHFTIDLGHKSVASENPLPRVHFLNAPDAIPVAHSEEHMVLEVSDSSAYHPGDVLYGVPDHICPSVSMFEEAFVCNGNLVTGSWKVIARNKKITI